MKKQEADKLIVEYLPKIYGFAMKKAFSYAEAEELSSDIVSEVYLSLLSAKDILNMELIKVLKVMVKKCRLLI